MKMMMKNQKEKHPKTRKGIRGEKKINLFGNL